MSTLTVQDIHGHLQLSTTCGIILQHKGNGGRDSGKRDRASDQGAVTAAALLGPKFTGPVPLVTPSKLMWMWLCCWWFNTCSLQHTHPIIYHGCAIALPHRSITIATFISHRGNKATSPLLQSCLVSPKQDGGSLRFLGCSAGD